MSLRRVVVTGLGAISPLGVGARSSWKRLIAGNSGIVSLNRGVLAPKNGTIKGHAKSSSTDDTFKHLNCRVAGLIPRHPSNGEHWDIEGSTSQDERRRTANFGLLAVSAATEALQDANWQPTANYDQERTGVCLGTGIGAFDDIYNTSISFEEKGSKRVSPFFVPRLLANMAAGAISMKFTLKGPSHAASTACTTGAHSIGDALHFIQSSQADVMVAGGAESCIHPLAFVGFERLQSLTTTWNEAPQCASRPFARDRDGFVIGEGAGILVLEEEQHALRRGARIYARLSGYGATSDAYHITTPPPNGDGARRSMSQALQSAGRKPLDVDYINAHATSTPIGDKAEAIAIRDLMDEDGRAWDPQAISVSSTKGATGHLLGAAGAIEAIHTVLAVFEDLVPATLNLHEVDPELPAFDYVPLEALRKQVKVALTNSFGFGGTNATLCFEKYLSKRNC